MRYLLAIILPFLSLILQGKVLQGILCGFLQLTVLGWIPAAFWAYTSLKKKEEDKRHQEVLQALKK